MKRLFCMIFVSAVLLAAKPLPQHVPTRCLQKVDFSRAQCRQESTTQWIVCKNVRILAACLAPGPGDEGTLTCSGILKETK